MNDLIWFLGGFDAYGEVAAGFMFTCGVAAIVVVGLVMFAAAVRR